jgi:hypothetical protein
MLIVICMMVICCVIIILAGVLWVIVRPSSIGPTSVVGITEMIFEDGCRTYMDPSSGTVAIDPTCKCCAHMRKPRV